MYAWAYLYYYYLCQLTPCTAITLASMQVKLAQEENQEASHGAMHLYETSPSLFLQKGFDLEDQQ